MNIGKGLRKRHENNLMDWLVGSLIGYLFGGAFKCLVGFKFNRPVWLFRVTLFKKRPKKIADKIRKSFSDFLLDRV